MCLQAALQAGAELEKEKGALEGELAVRSKGGAAVHAGGRAMVVLRSAVDLVPACLPVHLSPFASPRPRLPPPQDERDTVQELEAATASLGSQLTEANEAAARQNAAFEKLGKESMNLKEALALMKQRSAEMAVAAQVRRCGGAAFESAATGVGRQQALATGSELQPADSFLARPLLPSPPVPTAEASRGGGRGAAGRRRVLPGAVGRTAGRAGADRRHGGACAPLLCCSSCEPEPGSLQGPLRCVVCTSAVQPLTLASFISLPNARAARPILTCVTRPAPTNAPQAELTETQGKLARSAQEVERLKGELRSANATGALHALTHCCLYCMEAGNWGSRSS